MSHLLCVLSCVILFFVSTKVQGLENLFYQWLYSLGVNVTEG